MKSKTKKQQMRKSFINPKNPEEQYDYNYKPIEHKIEVIMDSQLKTTAKSPNNLKKNRPLKQ